MKQYMLSPANKYCMILIAALCSILSFIVPVYGNQNLDTTLTLRLVLLFTGNLEPASTSGLTYINNVWRGKTPVDTIRIESSLPVSYTLSGGISEVYSGYLTGLIPEYHTITIPSGDGVTPIRTIYSAQDTDYGQLPLQLLIGLDTTPPPLPYSISGPSNSLGRNDPVHFVRDTVVDSGAGMSFSSIQISKTNTFSSLIEFSTSGSSLIIAGGALEPGRWYRRWVGTDNVGNQTYSISSTFRIMPNGASSSFSQNNTTTHTPTPVSDFCPTGDISGEYFDGLCTPVSIRPFFTLTPPEHQAPAGPTWIDNLFSWINSSRLEPYIFPNYEVPKALTIYEYDPEYVYKDIYERTEPDDIQYPVVAYQPTFGKKEVAVGLHDHLPSFISNHSLKTGYLGNNYTAYMTKWYLTIQQSCTTIGPVCLEIGICGFDNMLCYEKGENNHILWCIWYP